MQLALAHKDCFVKNYITTSWSRQGSRGVDLEPKRSLGHSLGKVEELAHENGQSFQHTNLPARHNKVGTSRTQQQHQFGRQVGVFLH